MIARSSSLGSSRAILVVGAALAFAMGASVAHADVRLEGDWPEADRPVSLDVSAAPRSHAIELLADAAGFSVVMSAPLADPVDVHVKDQPASKVLSLLLPNGSYIAHRTGTLVSIQPADSASPAAAIPITVAPVAPTERGEDRRVFGGNMTLAKGEVAHDLAVFGGNVDVYGTLTGDLAVLGGNVDIHDGAKVLGSASVLGGHINVEDGAAVSHDISVVGGHQSHGGKNKVHGGHHGAEKTGLIEPDGPPLSAGARAWRAVSAWGDDALSSLSLSALLFLFGTVIVALATERSQALRVELAARPMRAIALGIVGAFGAAALSLALCVTIVGIPVALVFAVVFLLAAYAGVSAVLTTVGEALLRHRTTNAYVHLACGCAVYFVLGLVPWAGTWIAAAVFFAGVGLVVATRGAGLIPRGPGPRPQGFAFDAR